MEKNTIQKSLKQSRTVRGYEIHRMPLGAFLEAVELLHEAPMQLLAAAYPDKDAVHAIAALVALDGKELRETLFNTLSSAPLLAVQIASKLFGIPESDLLSDPEIGLDGLAEMMDAWLDLNDIENFLRAVRPLVSRIRTALGVSRQHQIGFNA